MSERNEVLKSYGNFVANLWEDETVLSALQADPHTVLASYGFKIPADAKINLIVREINLDGSPDTQVELIDKGEETGVYDFIVPLRPDGLELQDIPLNDEILELVAGGQASLAGCCPCCTCCPCCSSAQIQ